MKIRVNSYCQQIYSIEKIRVAISKKCKKLIEKNYNKNIKNIKKWYKLVILVKKDLLNIRLL